MREIKFRAWVKPTGMFAGEPYMAVQGTPDIESLQSFMHHYSDEALLMPFTGLCDIHGKDIFLGDIIDDGGIIKQVKWSDQNASFYLAHSDDKIHYHKQFGECGQWQSEGPVYNDIEVIGNIYQHPELLTQGD